MNELTDFEKYGGRTFFDRFVNFMWHHVGISAIVLVTFLLISQIGCSTPTPKELTLGQKVKEMRDDYAIAFVNFSRQNKEFSIEYDLRFIGKTNIMLLTLYSVSEVKSFVLMNEADLSMYVFLLNYEIKNSIEIYHWTWHNAITNFFGYPHYQTDSFKEKK